MNNSALLLFSAVCALLAGGCVVTWSDTSTIKGSGNIVSDTRKVSQFDRVFVSGSGQMSIVQGDDESLIIEADDNLLPLIKSEVSGTALKIGPEHVNLRPTKTIHYRLQLKSLKELHLSGSLEAESQSIKTDHLVVNISGSGKVQITRLEADGLDVTLSGSGDIQLAGRVNRQNIQISGSGNYRAGDCESQNTAIHVSGSGDATVWARVNLGAQVSGSGDIKYFGSPQVSSHVSGSGSVRSLGSR